MNRRPAVFAATVLLASLEAAKAGAATLPSGFQETVVFSGLTRPTAVRFASDGRVFVAEKSGLIKVFANLSSPTPTVFADLRTEVDDFWDRGLLGLALHPDFPATPYVYVLYSYDAPIGGTAPTWNDGCPSPPGATSSGCVISGRFSRLTAAGNVMTGTEQVLLEAWGQQFPSHSVGDLLFGPDGALYVSGGDGASFNNVDYGQYGIPLNPLGDPPVPAGGTQTAPTAEGGALRAQSLRRVEGGPALANGAILRVDDAGNPRSDNPLFGSSDPIARRTIAYGLRNPFRFTFQPGTGSVWIGDVGWSQWEEIDRISDPTDGTVPNFGWPCYEGVGQQSSYAGANLNLCTTLYATPNAVTPPVYSYKRGSNVVAGESCTTGSSSISGLAFYGGGSYPASYTGALFFADYSRQCAWVMFPGAGGQPDPSTRATFIEGAATPVDLQIGPGGDLYYVDHGGGTIRRVQYFAPTAVATAQPLSGNAPLNVHFDGSGSQPARPGDTISFAWDLDDDGIFDESTAVSPSFVYTQPGSHAARLRVTDNHGVSTTSDPITIDVGGVPPTVVIDSPAPSLTWKVGDAIAFSGHASDRDDRSLPASALSWTVILHHCPSTCHIHTLQSFTGVSSGSFAAPDHEYPSYLEVQLTAINSSGITNSASVQLNAQTVALSFQSSPSGMQIVVGSGGGKTPFTQTVIIGSTLSINAPSPQTSGGIAYGFASWSDGGASIHTVTAGASPVTYTATYTAADLSLAATGDPATVCVGGTLTYRLTVHNAGPSGAAATSATLALPPGTALLGASGDGWSCSGSSTLVCTRPLLAPGDAPLITVTARAPSVGGGIQASASVSATTSDPKTSNNLVVVPTFVQTTPAPPTAHNNGPVCVGEMLLLSADGVPGATYRWTGPGGFSSMVQSPAIPTVTSGAAGTYSVTTALNGCTSPPATTAVVVQMPPSVTIAVDSAICPASTENAAEVPDGGFGSTYTWSISNGTITSGAGTPSIRFSAGSNSAVPIVLTVTVQGSSGCVATGSVSLPIRSCVGSFFTVPSCRAVDTREPTGPFAGPALAAGADRTFALAGRCGIPADARAVALNVTVSEATGPGSLRLHAAGTPLPSATFVSYGAGLTRASNAVVAVSATGDLSVHCDQTAGSVELILDVSGYFR